MKKLCSLLLAVVFLANINIVSFAANQNSEKSVKQNQLNGKNQIQIEYEKNNNSIEMVIAHGYRITVVKNQITKEIDLYMSEKSDKFNLGNFSTANELVNDSDSYINDRHIGHYSASDSEKNKLDGIISRESIITLYNADYSNSYFIHYSSNRYVLKYKGDSVTRTSDLYYLNHYAYAFRDALATVDEMITALFFNILEPIEGSGLLLTLIDIIQVSVDDGNSGNVLIDIVNGWLDMEFPSLAKLLYRASVAANLWTLGLNSYYCNVYFNEVKDFVA